MKKWILKKLVLFGFLLLTVYVAVGLSFRMPEADELISMPSSDEMINIDDQSFASSVSIQLSNHSDEDDFVGNIIKIRDNSYFDEIRIGITNDQTSIIEFWNKGSFVEGVERGFKSKFKLNKTYNLFVGFDDNSTIRVLLRDAVFGAFNEIAENTFDYSFYADDLSISTIALSGQGSNLVWTDFQVWGDWQGDD